MNRGFHRRTVSPGINAGHQNCDACANSKVAQRIASLVSAMFATVAMFCAIASWGKSLALSSFFNPASAYGTMNTLGSIMATTFGLVKLVHVYVIYRLQTSEFAANVEQPVQPTQICHGIMKKASTENGMVYFVTAYNFCAIMCYSFDFFGGDCQVTTCQNGWPNDDGCVTTGCITSINAVNEFKATCERERDHATFDCDYSSPSLWVATMVFLCFAMAVNSILLASILLAPRHDLQSGETGVVEVTEHNNYVVTAPAMVQEAEFMNNYSTSAGVEGAKYSKEGEVEVPFATVISITPT